MFRTFILFLFLLVPAAASAQSFVAQGSAGPTIIDSGHSVAAGVGFSPTSRVTLLFDVERTHLSSRAGTNSRGGGGAFRGGTVTLGAVEVRIGLRGTDRFTPYVLGGFAAGVSRPTVNEFFPNRVTNNVRAVFFGGGVHVPLRERVGLFADGRMIVGGEAGESLAMVPVRAGITWRF